MNGNNNYYNPIQSIVNKQGKKLTPDQEKKLVEDLPEEWQEYQDSLRVNIYLNRFITINSEMLEIKKTIKTLADYEDIVLICGETGTGKELLANALHGERKGRFVPLNCAGVPDTLVESELFGHVRGAFTDAKSEKIGLMQAAENGTLFLDEIGELPMLVQAKLLRALSSKKIRRVGADMENEGEIDITCRIVCATHRNLLDMVEQKKFREDLYWRIQTFIIKTLPIRKRTEDIRPIIKHLCIKAPKDLPFEIDEIDEFSDYLMKHKDKLTGNVRQIESIVRNYQVLGTMFKFE